MKFLDKFFKKENTVLKIIYIGILSYSFLTFILVDDLNLLPIPLSFLIWESVFLLLDFPLLSFLLFPVLLTIFIILLSSLFMKRRKLKIFLNILFESILIFDIILSLPRTPWCHYSLQIEGYMIGCILLDCLFFILIAVGIFVDGKIVALEKRTEHD